MNGTRKFFPLALILIIGLIHGGIYVFLIPPWQHYDEPTHFEYAWLIANQQTLPGSASFDSEMRREVAASMLEHGFFRELEKPNLLLDKPGIGITQTNDQPLYYLFSAIPLRLLMGADITLQLYTVRLISLSMFLMTLVIAYFFSKEIFPNFPSLHTILPLSLALTPSFVDIMTAFNNDVGATLFFSLFLLIGVKILSHGVTTSRIILFLLLSGICFFVKATVFVAIPLSLLLLTMTIFNLRPPYHKMGYFLIPFLILVGFFSFFTTKDAAYWYRTNSASQQDMPTKRVINDKGQTNSFFQITSNNGDKNKLTIFQPLSSQDIAILRGMDFSLGVWMWATEPINAQMISIWQDGTGTNQVVSLDKTPEFFTFSGSIENDAERIHVVINPFLEISDHPVSIYLDDIVLSLGKYSAENTPEFSSDDHSYGIWGEKEFINIIRNPSTDSNWLTIRPAVLQNFRDLTYVPNYALPALQDMELTLNIFINYTAKNLFKTFWALFGWNHVNLALGWYYALFGITIFGTISGFAFTIQNWKNYTPGWKLSYFWLLICTLTVWLAAIVRTTLPFWNLNLFIPAARYAYPVILPTMMLIISGFLFIGKSRLQFRWILQAFIIFLVVLDIVSILTNYHYHYQI